MIRTQRRFRRSARRQRVKRTVSALRSYTNDPFGIVGCEPGITTRLNPRRSLLGPWRIAPSEVVTILPYVEEFKRAPGAPIDDYRWNLNSIFDPDLTSTGHQPMGYDPWSTLYSRYRVMKVKVTLVVKNHASFDGCVITQTPNNSASALSPLAAAESQWSKTTTVGQASGMDVKSITTTFDLPLILGRTPAQYRADDRYSAVFGTSPMQTCVLHTVVSSITGNNVDLSYYIKLEYLVELFDRVQLPLS